MREEMCNSQAGGGHSNGTATYRKNFYVHNWNSLKAGITTLIEKSVYVRGAWLIANVGETQVPCLTHIYTR